ncbi:MAG TPA: hypothetical protein VFR86_27775, partial [Burkholderiaceae bacterium]|nr:hypothetical protein [Burkholderiaceae bacterium]
MIDALEQGRAAYGRRAWRDAYQALSRADHATALTGDDLERLATAAYLIGHDIEFLRIVERAHHAYRAAGNTARAARCAFWLGLGLLLRGETGPATGWLARAARLLEQRDCVEQGFLLLPAAEQRLRAGDTETAHATAARAAAMGDRFGDADLSASARHLQGRSLILQGRVHAGLALLDEAMLAVVVGELSPIMTGLIYCSVIDACHQVYEMRRAREWTTALAQWCEQQPEMVAFTGACRVHRAEILQLQGAWPDALAEASRARERFDQGEGTSAASAEALYRQAEMHRLHGDFAAAEEAYQAAN